MKVGIVGVGIMGKPMARNLIKAGFSVVAHNRSRAPVDELVKDGATAASSPREVAAQSEFIITMLPNSPDVEAVALGPNGIREVARAGQLLIDMSTINPMVSRKIGETLEPLGMGMLDAPVSGGETGAIQGILSIMTGGRKEDFDRALPVLQAMGKTITYMGPLGAGGFTKLANQIVIGGYLGAISEALVFGKKNGLDLNQLMQALSGGMAASRCLEIKAPQMTTGNFTPGFKVDLHYKDMTLVHDVARDAGIPVPVGALVEQLLAALRTRGLGGADHSAIVKIFEDLAGVKL